jgi:hypothetical protein
MLRSVSSLVICREYSSTVPACWARAREKTIHGSDRESIRCSWQLISGIVIPEIATATSTTSSASQPSDDTNTDGIFLAAAHVSTSAHPPERAPFHELSPTIMNTRDQLETASCAMAWLNDSSHRSFDITTSPKVLRRGKLPCLVPAAMASSRIRFLIMCPTRRRRTLQ